MPFEQILEHMTTPLPYHVTFIPRPTNIVLVSLLPLNKLDLKVLPNVKNYIQYTRQGKYQILDRAFCIILLVAPNKRFQLEGKIFGGIDVL